MTSPLISTPCKRLHGTVEVPGDKSISHRALMLASQAVGVSHIQGLLEGEDVIHTAKALKNLGVPIERSLDHIWTVKGVGTGGLSEPDDILDMGNSGTGARLMMGLVTPYPFTTFFTGDISLRSRPMGRVTIPLTQMGAQVIAREKARLPLALIGTSHPIPITYSLPVASAQVKSAVLLAGLNTPGHTSVIETAYTRDHTERMLTYFGAAIAIQEQADGSKKITITGQPELIAKDITVPGDPSSAAFLMVAALITPESDITIQNVCMNPYRTGLFTTLQEMGADITFLQEREMAGETVANIRVRSSALTGVEVPAERAPSMIDEYPILSVAAAFAKGKTIMRGLEELRVKESDRLSAIAEGLALCGVPHEAGHDSLTVEGKLPQGGAMIRTRMDHRIAMSFLVMGMAAKQQITVDSSEMIATSFPGFITLMNELGGAIATRS